MKITQYKTHPARTVEILAIIIGLVALGLLIMGLFGQVSTAGLIGCGIFAVTYALGKIANRLGSRQQGL